MRNNSLSFQVYPNHEARYIADYGNNRVLEVKPGGLRVCKGLGFRV